MTMLHVRPNVHRRAILMGLLVYKKIEISKDSDQRLKPFMALVELGELCLVEAHGHSVGVTYRKFTLTERGMKAAQVIAAL